MYIVHVHTMMNIIACLIAYQRNNEISQRRKLSKRFGKNDEFDEEVSVVLNIVIRFVVLCRFPLNKNNLHFSF